MPLLPILTSLSYHLRHPFTLSFTTLLNTSLVRPHPFISGHAIPLLDKAGVGGRGKEKGDRDRQKLTDNLLHYFS